MAETDSYIKEAVEAVFQQCYPRLLRSWELAVADSLAESNLQAERDRIAELVEQMGMWGYGTLAIAAAIRSGTKASELDDITSPADRRKFTNRPWSAP